VPATSGLIQKRYCLNRGGARQANAALWRIAMVRLSSDPTTREYLARRQTEGKTKIEAMRCLKRYIAPRGLQRPTENSPLLTVGAPLTRR